MCSCANTYSLPNNFPPNHGYWKWVSVGVQNLSVKVFLTRSLKMSFDMASIAAFDSCLSRKAQTQPMTLSTHAMVAVSVWKLTGGITWADSGHICATPDKISKALASGCQLFFLALQLNTTLDLIVSLLGISLLPPCCAHWYCVDFSVFGNSKLDNHLRLQPFGSLILQFEVLQ